MRIGNYDFNLLVYHGPMELAEYDELRRLKGRVKLLLPCELKESE